MKRLFSLIIVITMLSGLMLEVHAVELTELQKKSRALLNNNREVIKNVALDQLKKQIPSLQGNKYSGLMNVASNYLGGNSSISQTLTQSLQDAQMIFTNSLNLMEITKKFTERGTDINSLTTADLQQMLTASQNIYNSSTRIMNLVKTNAELYNTLTGAYNQLNSGNSDWNSKVELLLKILPYLKK